MSLSNIFSNKFDDLVNTSDKEDDISHYQIRNKTSSWLLNKKRNKVIGCFEMEKEALKRNRVVNYFEIKEGAIRKNRIAEYF